MKRIDYYNKGFNDARFKSLHFVKNAKRSWQKQAYMQGYQAGRVYLEAEALLNGFETANEYQKHLIKLAIREEESQFAEAERVIQTGGF